MAVHSFHVFDRKGQTLFTKRYGGSSKALSDGSNKSSQNNKSKNNRKNEDAAQLSEQRKLVFGMLFSLRELSGSLSPSEGPGDLQVVKTGASFLYHYETVSGLRFVLYASTPEYSYTHSLYDANRGGSGGLGSGGNSSNHGSVGGETGGGGGASLPQASASNSAVGGSGAAGGAGGSGSGSGAAGLPNNQATTTHQEATGSGGLSGGAGAGGSSAQSSKKEANASDVRNSLRHIYETLWVGCVVRSPMYRPTKARESIAATGFEAELDKYLKQKTWFR